MFLPAPADSEATARLYQGDLASQGFVMNLIRLWAWRPEVYEGFVALRKQLMEGSSLSGRELAVLVCATAGELGDSYCALAWGKKLAAAADAALAAAVLRDAPCDALSLREQALSAWARQVVQDPNATTSVDVGALRDAGLSEREIFEATTFVAFRLAFSTINDALGVRPDWQLAASAPVEVSEAVRFGRPPAEK
jgi:uncharacterized peroxidase-related enzyme